MTRGQEDEYVFGTSRVVILQQEKQEIELMNRGLDGTDTELGARMNS